eukprot:13776159-Alexandrium_andersonii.AAC.1
MVTQLMPPDPTQRPEGHPWVHRRESVMGPPFWGCREHPNCKRAMVAKPMAGWLPPPVPATPVAPPAAPAVANAAEAPLVE